MPQLPRGTVAVRFTDTAGSTRLGRAHPQAMRRADVQHGVVAAALVHLGPAVGSRFAPVLPAAHARAVAAATTAPDEGPFADAWEAARVPPPEEASAAAPALPDELAAGADVAASSTPPETST